MTPRWRPVPNFPGYEISEYGRVISYMRRKPRIRRWQFHRVGYPFLVLRRDRKSINKFVHQLVLESFVGPCPPGMECCHLDGDCRNPRLTNLRWGTHRENMADRHRHGTSIAGRPKFTTERKREILRALLAGECVHHLADRHGVSASYLYQVRKRRYWRDLDAHNLGGLHKAVYSPNPADGGADAA